MRTLKIVPSTLLVLVGAYLLLVCAAPFTFSYEVRYGAFDVYSDQPVAPQITTVIDDAVRRLHTSTLYTPDQRFRVVICNSNWRLWLFSQRFSWQMGGAADTWLTRNIYIRASDIAHNALLPPGPRPLSDA
ncbi:MAG: hypothetical protein JO218_17875, partial [Burkholderiales bacterium]|nr:hypothetical protein [Burkholderiales bacterium]